MSSKEDKIFNVTLAIFDLEQRDGHLAWKVTDLEKRVEISRTLIYKYFGNSKEEIFFSAFSFFIEKFYGAPKSLSRKSDLSNCIYSGRKILSEYPSAIVFYQKWRSSQNKEIKNQFVKVERDFQETLSNIFPDTSHQEVKMIHALIHGFVSAPFLSPSEAKAGFEKLMKRIN